MDKDIKTTIKLFIQPELQTGEKGHLKAPKQV